MPIIYDPKRPGLILLRYKGTVFQSVVFSPTFWVCILVNLLFVILRYSGVISNTALPEVSEKFISLTGFFLLFSECLVFRSPSLVSLFFACVSASMCGCACAYGYVHVRSPAESH